ncbi:Crp/Fnr family transcriptional regulator [Sphingosinicella terrae]|uniref:Crp/Fnr family transcriptional regulator n=1 Tax=Sphingosinicella terrae TaxID=2172047 RepID=UPI000E0D3663|nr:Crp/Fnr family transcriptional regulator [Sphingosinicella terrae]
MIDTHLMKLRARDRVSEEEERAIRGAVSEVREFAADKTIIRAGEDLTVSLLLVDGILCRYKDLSDGQRQITELHVSGDFADLHSFTLKRLDHNVMTMSRCRIAIVPHERLKAITEQHPHLTRLYWFTTNLDAAIHREWEVSLGRRPSLARIAHLFCELQARLGLVGLVNGDGYDLPLTQTEIAECMGLTPVHVNRTLRELRERGLLEFRSGRVSIPDLAALARVAEFDPAYLYLEPRAR